MRCVTKNPPTTLIVASTVAKKPSPVVSTRDHRPGRDHRADHRDARDGVRARRERRMQNRRHLGDDLEADEHGQHEDRQHRDETASCSAFLGGGREQRSACSDRPVVGDQRLAGDFVVQVELQFPCFSRCCKNVATFLANIWLA